MVEFKAKKGESFEGLLRRFNRRLLQSKKLFKVRECRYAKPSKSRSEQKKSALIGLKYKSQKEYLRKTGKLKEETGRKW